MRRQATWKTAFAIPAAAPVTPIPKGIVAA